MSRSRAEVFLEQARSCEPRSRLYADLCRRLAGDPRVSRLAPELRWDVPLRLLGGVHYLVLSGRAPDAFNSWERFSDTSPADVTSDEDGRLLRSFVWADQVERLRRLDRAIDLLRHDPPELVQGDFVELLPRVLSARRADGLTVVFQTGTLGYLTPEQRSRLHATLREAGAAAPLAFVSTGAPRERGATHWGVSLQTWPRGERVLLAEADYHGSWLEWQA